MTQVLIKNGVYRNKAVNDVVFNLVKGYQTGAKGGFVTVESDGYFGSEFDVVRVRVDGIGDIEYTGGESVTATTIKPTAKPKESDEEAIARIRERFEILDQMTKATTAGDIRAMIVSGPPGVGKSFGVEKIIDKATLFDQLAGRKLKAEVVKGAATPIGLYQTLYKYSDPNCVVVFDDCDSILLDDVSLNLLKGALDSGKKRKISWLSESRVLRSDGVLFEDMGLDTDAEREVIAFMEINQDKLREVSLRMAIKVAQLRKSFPNNWTAMARTTCMKPAE